VKVDVLRGPEYWWMAQTGFTQAALALIAFMWIGFYVVRWIVRGFSRT